MDLESALIIVPPRPVQSFAFPIRETYDAESFNRVPAHITLLYPFVPPDQVEEAEKVLAKICKKYLSLKGFNLIALRISKTRREFLLCAA